MENVPTTGQMKETPEIDPASLWSSPPESLTLGSDEVHVWRVDLCREVAHLQSFQQVLAGDERARADRFYFEKDRQHFIVARGLLRILLGRYLNKQPHRLQFCYGPHGKPALVRELGGDDLRFNLSHSNGLVLYAITRGRELGIDLEYLRSWVSDEQIAERFFSPREVAALRALPDHARQRAFFNCWTRKEAYIKAKGEGLTLRLDQFEVSLVPGEPAALLRTYGDPQEASRWSLRELAPGPGYVAAVAVEGHSWQLKRWQWPA